MFHFSYVLEDMDNRIAFCSFVAYVIPGKQFYSIHALRN
jgi:hypothetical protein